MNMKNERPRASVVIIAYNDETHIERAIQSVCNQTERNIEIICVNDGSTDATCEIMRRCAQRDERIRVISQPNSGALGARYTGLRHMTSDYALFLDSDDVFMPEAVETACAAADETGADVLEFGVSLVIDESNPPSKETYTYLEGYFSQEKPVPDTDHGPELIKACFTEQGSVTWNIWNKLYRKELLQKAYQFYQGEWVCLVEDTLLTLMVLCQAERYARIPTKLHAYTIGGGISTTKEKLSSESELKQAAAVGLTIKLAREWMTKLGCTQDAAVSGLVALTDSLRAVILDQILYRVAAEKRNEYFSLLSQNCEKNDFFDLISQAVFRQQRQIEQLEEENRRLWESFNTISNSTCWRMTAPMRMMLDAVKMTQFGYLTREAVRCWRTQGFRAMSKKAWDYASKRQGLLLKVSMSTQKKKNAEECGDREA